MQKGMVHIIVDVAVVNIIIIIIIIIIMGRPELQSTPLTKR